MFSRKKDQDKGTGDTGIDITLAHSGEYSTTVIGSGTEVEGRITSGKGADVYGVFIGDICLQEGTARVMYGGRVNGDIRAPAIEVGGVVEGRCEGHCVTVLEQGVLKGMCCSAEFSIRSGGVFTGTSEAWPDTEKKAVSMMKKQNSTHEGTMSVQVPGQEIQTDDPA